MFAHNIDLASQAAEALTCLAEGRPREVVEAGAIEGLVELLRECAEHARAVEAAGGSGVGAPGHTRRRSAGTSAAAVAAAYALYPGGGGGDEGGAAPRPLSAASSRRGSSGSLAAAGAGGSPARRRHAAAGGPQPGRPRPRVSLSASVACLVCASDGHESCGFCPMSSALKGLLRIMAPEPHAQARFVSAGGVGLVFELMRPEVGHPHSRVMQSLASLLAVALAGRCGAAQDEARAAGGLEVLIAALASLASQHGPAPAPVPASGRESPGVREGFTSFDVYQLRFGVLNALALALDGNAASRVAFREQGGLAPAAALLRQLLAGRAGGGPRAIEDGEHLEGACLALLAAALADSPANQAAAAQLGLAPPLLALAAGPAAAREPPPLRRLAAGVVGLIAEAQPAVAEAAVAAGAVQALMGRLQEGPGDEEEQELLAALARLLRGSGAPGRRAAIQARGAPLLVRLLRAAPSPRAAAAAAGALAEIAAEDAETRSHVVQAGGLAALMERLEAPAAAARQQANGQGQGQQQLRQEGGGASGGGGGQQQGAAAAAAAAGGGEAPPQDPAFSAIADALRPPSRQASRASAVAAAAAASAAADAAADAAALAYADAALMQAACLRLLSALSEGNSFAKNSARQAAVFELLAGLLARLQPAAEGEAAGDAASAAATDAAAQQAGAALQRRALSRSSSLGAGARHRRHPSDLDTLPEGSGYLTPPRAPPAAAPPQPPGAAAAAAAVRRAELRLLTAAAQACADLTHGNHSNQDSMAAEGLIERAAALLAALVGAGLPAAARAAAPLGALCAALGSACEFHGPNKTLARETGAADALARFVLLAGAAEPPALARAGLPRALAAACGAALSLAQDCGENQRLLARHSGGAFVPALLRLMAAGDPELAAAAAQCVAPRERRAVACRAPAAVQAPRRQRAHPAARTPARARSGRWSTATCAPTRPRASPRASAASTRRTWCWRWCTCWRWAPRPRRRRWARAPPRARPRCCARSRRTAATARAGAGAARRWSSCGRRPTCWSALWRPAAPRRSPRCPAAAAAARARALAARPAVAAARARGPPAPRPPPPMRPTRAPAAPPPSAAPCPRPAAPRRCCRRS